MYQFSSIVAALPSVVHLHLDPDVSGGVRGLLHQEDPAVGGTDAAADGPETVVHGQVGLGVGVLHGGVVKVVDVGVGVAVVPAVAQIPVCLLCTAFYYTNIQMYTNIPQYNYHLNTESLLKYPNQKENSFFLQLVDFSVWEGDVVGCHDVVDRDLQGERRLRVEGRVVAGVELLSGMQLQGVTCGVDKHNIGNKTISKVGANFPVLQSFFFLYLEARKPRKQMRENIFPDLRLFFILCEPFFYSPASSARISAERKSKLQQNKCDHAKSSGISELQKFY